MAALNFAHVFCTAEALNEDAGRAFKTLLKNRQYLLSAGDSVEQPAERQRGGTPAYDYDDKPKLGFTLEPESFFDPRRGLLFGSDEDKVDVLLDKDNCRGVSGVHFAVRFAWERDPHPLELILSNFSANGTRVSKTLLAPSQPCILDQQGPNLIEAGPLLFTLELRQFKSTGEQAAFLTRWGAFVAEAGEAEPRLASLTVGSRFGPTPNIPLRSQAATKSTTFSYRIEKVRAERSKHAARPEHAGAIVERQTISHAAVRAYTKMLNPSPRRSARLLEKDRSVIATFRDNKKGHVYLVKNASNSAEYVVKRVNKNMDINTTVELKMARTLQHETIIDFLDTFDSVSYVELYMPLAKQGCLYEYLDYAERTLDTIRLARLAAQMLEALNYLQGRKIVHRDISPANILVMSDRPIQFKLADFGVALDLNADDPTSRTYLGTPAFIAPEVLPLLYFPGQYEGSPYSSATDVYSLGAVLWFAATGRSVDGSDEELPDTDIAPTLSDESAIQSQQRFTVAEDDQKGVSLAQEANTLTSAETADPQARLLQRLTTINDSLSAKDRLGSELINFLQHMLADRPRRRTIRACREDPWLVCNGDHPTHD
ncbi:Protein kinase domain-containing protein 37 [Elsinoe fawcettii]|nr:Protein kinase domain-containing protein 37 [Elsinoe fawcettii]